MNRLLHWCVALTAAAGLAVVGRAVHAPAFVLDDVTILLVVAIALVSGVGPAIVTATFVVAADDLMPIAAREQLPLTLLENLLDLSLLIGVALVVNRLVVRAREAQAFAEQAAERERRMREERERVVATVAHDLATPLTVVRGTVQAVQRTGLAQDATEHRLLRRIESAATRASSLVRTLTEVEDTSGIRPDRTPPLDLRDVVRTVAEMMQPVSNRHAIVLELPDVRVSIQADAERLHRVFENIIGNAIKYSPDGGEINVSVHQGREKATIVIRDHGIGIALEARDRIFDLSYRAPEALSASAGRGLGLHIAAQIVTAHGGTIAAQAAPGGGTAIVVTLPLVAAPAPAERA